MNKYFLPVTIFAVAFICMVLTSSPTEATTVAIGTGLTPTAIDVTEETGVLGFSLYSSVSDTIVGCTVLLDGNNIPSADVTNVQIYRDSNKDGRWDSANDTYLVATLSYISPGLWGNGAINYAMGVSAESFVVTINLEDTASLSDTFTAKIDTDAIQLTSDGWGPSSQAALAGEWTVYNNPPYISPVVPSDTRAEDTVAWTVDLTSYENDTNADPLTWSVSGGGSVLTASVNGGDSITYTPIVDATGTDTFTLSLSDGSSTVTQNVQITLTNVNDAPYISPTIPDDTREEDTAAWTIDLTNYENDTEADPLSWSVTGGGTAVNASVSGGDTLNITPIADASGVDTLTLSLTDASSTVTQNVVITITAVNDAPVANAGADSIGVTSFVYTLVGSASYDPDSGDVITYQWTQTGGTNAVSISNDTQAVATVTITFADTYTFQLVVTDSYGLTDTDTMQIFADSDAAVDTSGANNWYVNATTGDTANDGLSSGNAKKYISQITNVAGISQLTSGDTINIAAGLYYDTIAIDTDYIFIVGADSTTTIIDAGDSVTSTVYGIYTDGQTGLNLSEFAITGAYYGVYLNNADNAIISSMHVSECGNDGLELTNGADYVTVTASDISDNLDAGVLVSSCSYVVIDNNTISTNANDGIEAIVAAYGQVDNNVLDSNGSNAIGFYQGSSNNNVQGNNVNNNVDGGITFDYSSSNTAIGNTCSGNSRGFLAAGSDYILAVRNIIRDNTGQGIVDTGCSFNTYSGNEIDSNAGTGGVYINNSSSCTFSRNNFTPGDGCDTLIYNVSGSNIVAEYNYWGSTSEDTIFARIIGLADSIDWHPYRTGRVDTTAGGDSIAPGAPVGLSAETSTPGQITLSWANVTLNEDGSALADLAGYYVYRCSDVLAPLSDWKNDGFLASDNDTSYTDTDVVAGQTYHYRVSAYDVASPWVNESSFSDTLQVMAAAVAGSALAHASPYIAPAAIDPTVGETPVVALSVYGQSPDTLASCTVTITFGGTLDTDSFDTVAIWSDQNTNGSLDTGVDAKIATLPWASGNYWVASGIGFDLLGGSSDSFLITISLDDLSVPGDSFTVAIDTGGIVLVGAGPIINSIVSAGAWTVGDSSGGSNDTVYVVTTPIVPMPIDPTDGDTALLAFTIYGATPDTLAGCTITVAGNITNADFDSGGLWHDSNANGQLDVGIDVLLGAITPDTLIGNELSTYIYPDYGMASGSDSFLFVIDLADGISTAAAFRAQISTDAVVLSNAGVGPDMTWSGDTWTVADSGAGGGMTTVVIDDTGSNAHPVKPNVSDTGLVAFSVYGAAPDTMTGCTVTIAIGGAAINYGDFDTVSLYQDVNYNGNYDLGVDNLITSLQYDGTLLNDDYWIDTDFAHGMAGGYDSFVVACNLRDGVSYSETFAVKFDTGNIVLASSGRGPAAAVAQSGFWTIMDSGVGGGDPVNLVAHATVTPGAIDPTADTLILSLTAYSNAVDTLTSCSLSLTLMGGLTDNDVDSIAIWCDVNVDGLFDPGIDGFLDTFAFSPPYWVATGIDHPLCYGTSDSFLITLDLRDGVEVGDTLQLDVPPNGLTMAVAGQGPGTPYNQPGDWTVGDSSAPGYYTYVILSPGLTPVPINPLDGETGILGVTIGSTAGADTLTSCSIALYGSLTSTAVDSIGIYWDMDNDGAFTQGLDDYLATLVYAGGAYWQATGIDYWLGSGDDSFVFVIDLADTAANGLTFSAKIDTGTVTQATAGNGPSAAVELVGSWTVAGDTCDVKLIPGLTAGALRPSQGETTILAVSISGAASDTLTSCSIALAGSLTSTDVDSIGMYQDADYDGSYSIGDLYLASLTGLGGSLWGFNAVNYAMPPDGTDSFVFTIVLADTAVEGNNFTSGIDTNCVRMSYAGDGPPQAVTLAGLWTVAGDTVEVLLSSGVTPGLIDVNEETAIFAFTLRSSGGADSFAGCTVTLAGSISNTDVDSVGIYRDMDEDGQYTFGSDQYLGDLTYAGGSYWGSTLVGYQMSASAESFVITIDLADTTTFVNFSAGIDTDGVRLLGAGYGPDAGVYLPGTWSLSQDTTYVVAYPQITPHAIYNNAGETTIFSFSVYASDYPDTLSGCTVTITGSPLPVTDVDSVGLYQDIDYNGKFSPWVDNYITTLTYASGNHWSATNIDYEMDFDYDSFVISIDLADTAATVDSFSVSLDANSIQLTNSGGGPVAPLTQAGTWTVQALAGPSIFDTSVVINWGDTQTNSGSVTLNIYSDVNAYEMQVSNENTFASAAWDPYVSSKLWSLDVGGGAVKTVFVRFRNVAGGVSAVASDSITLDNTPPTGLSITINNGDSMTTSEQVIYQYGCSDDTPNLQWRVSGYPDGMGAVWNSFSDTIDTGIWDLMPGADTKVLYFQVMDTVGNIATASDSIYLANSVMPVTGLYAISVAGGNVTLNWMPSYSPDVDTYNIYCNWGGGQALSYAQPCISVDDWQYTYETGPFTPGDTVIFGVRVVNTVGFEEQNTNITAVAEIISETYNMNAYIFDPPAGLSIGGDFCFVQADLFGDTGVGAYVTFQYRQQGTNSWSRMPVTEYDSNPVWSYPYETMWDLSGLNDGFYELRAVAWNESETDPAPSYITIEKNTTNPDIYAGFDEEGNIDYQEPVYENKPVESQLSDTWGTYGCSMPANVITDNTTIKLSVLNDTMTALGGVTRGDFDTGGVVLEIDLSSGQDQFTDTITVTIPYTDNNNDGIIDGTRIRLTLVQIIYYDDDDGQWHAIARENTHVDTTRKVIVCYTNHFSKFSAGKTTVGGDLGSGGGDDVPDGDVDSDDLGKMNGAFGASSGSGNYNENADIVTTGRSEGRVDEEDLFKFSAQYGQ